MKQLTPYQRCLKVIKGQKPDKIPAYTPTIACEVASKLLGRSVDTGGPSLWYAEAQAWAKGDNAHTDFLQKYEESLLALNRTLGIEVFRYGFRKTDRPAKQIDEFTFLYGDSEGEHQVWKWDNTVGNFFPIKNTARKRQPEDMPDIARKMYRNLPKTLENINSIDVLPEQRLQASIGEEMMV